MRIACGPPCDDTLMDVRVAPLVVLYLTLAFVVMASTSSAQTVPQYIRKSDVIYGRRAGLALTLEIFTPVKPAGPGVVWVVSSGGVREGMRHAWPGWEADRESIADWFDSHLRSASAR